MKFLSYFEPLTGLAKRALFCERLTALLTRSKAGLPRLAVTVFDIEHLSVINDSFGRHTGDRLLQCVAERLKGTFWTRSSLLIWGAGPSSPCSALPDGANNESSRFAAGSRPGYSIVRSASMGGMSR